MMMMRRTRAAAAQALSHLRSAPRAAPAAARLASPQPPPLPLLRSVQSASATSLHANAGSGSTQPSSPPSSSTSSSAPASASPASPAAAIDRPHASASLLDVLNSYAVFRLCASPTFVTYGPKLLDLTNRARLSGLTKPVVKHTFFKHFCGGETTAEVEQTMNAYRTKHNVGVILNLALEADLSPSSTADQTPAEILAAVTANAASVSRGMQESVDLAAHHPHNFIAAKLTPFFPPELLMRWSATLTGLRDAVFGDGRSALNGKSVGRDEFVRALAPAVGDKHVDDVEALFDDAARRSSSTSAGAPPGTCDWIGLSGAVSIASSTPGGGGHRALLSALSAAWHPADASLHMRAHDFEVMDAVMPHVEALIQRAVARNVKVIVDAEWTYVQPAIDDVAVALGTKYNGRRGVATEGVNGGRPVIFNTYQMYLKDSFDRMRLEVERAKRLGVNVGVKLVRGAYMLTERERAAKLRYPDPVHDTIEDTHRNYNAGVAFCVDRIVREAGGGGGQSIALDTPLPVQLFVASHNLDSVAGAMALMAENGIQGNTDAVGFGQLMGMQDATTYMVAAKGYRGYKVVPYGPVDVTIPYLVRRAQENASVLGGAWRDRKSLGDELRHRAKAVFA